MPPRKKVAKNGKDEDTDYILEAEKIKLQPVKDSELNVEDPEEDVDDPRSSNLTSQIRDKPEKPVETDPNKIMHSCIMNTCSEVKGTSHKQSCTKKKALLVPVSGLLQHYFLHYREQGFWNKLCPKTKPEDHQRIEHYRCSICGHKFRVKDKGDPEPQRQSFLYHYAISHGKIIDAIREDLDLDGGKIEEVFEILRKYNPDMRKFVDEGTDTSFDKEPYSIGEQCEWKLRQMQSGAVPTPQNYMRAMEEPLKCPFGDRSDCKDLSNNRNVGTLKLHLFYHYLDFWKVSVPEFNGTEFKCDECGKRLNALNPSALRTTIICHRAIQHNELKDAIEDSIVDFDQDLFNRMYNPSLVPKPKLIYPVTKSVSVPTSSFYKPPQNSNQLASSISSNKDTATSRPILVDNSNKEKTKKNQLLKKKGGGKRNKRSKFFSDSDKTSSSESDVEAVIPQQPYVRKRIKQNLSNIDFEEDSDKDSDWEEKEKKKVILKAASGKRPSRNSIKKKTYEEPDSD